MNVICLNGEFLSLEDARVSATDAGFTIGHGVFETIRVEQGHPLFLKDHLARMARGARLLEIPYQIGTEDLLDLCHQTLDANHLREARLRITLTPGPTRNQPVADDEGVPTLAITATGLDPRLETDRRRGWRAVLTPIPRNHRSPLSTVKCTSYMESWMARRYATRRGFDEGLLLNTDGLLAEAAMSNLFIVRDGQVLTPSISQGALPGTQRARMALVCQHTGIKFAEDGVTVEDLVTCEEAFLTNALIQVMPLVQMGEQLIGSGSPGRIAARLQEGLRQLVDEYLQSSRA